MTLENSASPEDLFTGSPEAIHDSNTTNSQHQHFAPHLNPRSCVTCRKRKVRCDKVEPSCGNCTKAGSPCVFPAPGRAPRKPRRPPDAELLKRLRRLEGVVQSLGAHVDDEEPKVASPPSAQPSRNSSIAQDRCSVEVLAKADEVEDVPLGRLVISDGHSRYVNNSYWQSVGNEISDIHDLLDQSDDDDEHPPENQPTWETPDQGGFMFSFSSTAVDMQKLYPLPSQTFVIWKLFKENVDPVVKVLHCPSVRNLVMKAAVNTSHLSKPAEAVFFSVCFVSVVSITEDRCLELLGESKLTMWKKYRFATEQAMARADFMNSSSLMVLQAFILYLICLRFYDASKSVWALGGLAIQLAYTQGLHRDGTHFGLDPFETEMRRRLWWHLAILDVRAAEDHGTELRTTRSTYDTKFPSNVNDDDIWPGMDTAPVNKPGATEMTFCLLRFELSAMTRRLDLHAGRALNDAEVVKVKEDLIDSFHRELEEKYVKQCDMNVPIYWVAATVSRLILAKMWLKLHQPRLSGNGLYEHPELRERVFTTSVEVIEFGHLLESNENTEKWGWLFRTYMQWQAIAYVLSELCVRPPTSEVDRAWRAIESVYEDSEQSKKQRGMLWKPIRQLMAKAKAHRERSHKIAPMASEQGVVDAMNPWASQAGNVVNETAGAFDLDLSDAAVLDELQNAADAMGLTFGEAGLLNGLPNNELMTSPGKQSTQGSTPDFFSWPGWSPGGVDYSAPGPPGQPIDAEYFKPQEWF